MLLVAFAGAGFLIFVWITPHGRQGRPERPSAPTAAEEGGGVGEITTASPRAQVSGPGTAARRPVAPHHVVQVGPLTPPVMPEYGVGVGVSSGKGQIGEREDSSKPSSGGDQRLAEKPAAPVRESDRAPFLTPPAVLTPVAGYPSGLYRVVLDRSVLTPQLRVEAAQGRVVLRILVRSQGSVAQVNVVESSGSQVLDERALKSSVKVMFAPASRDGQPV